MASSSTKTSNITLKKSKKSKINIQLPKTVKRRGLYVEKKDAKSSDEENKSKSPPRRDKSSFLYAALNMLSKPSASTQFPDPELHKASQSFDFKDSRKKIKARIPPKVKINENKDVGTDFKKKFRSRILNELRDYKESEVTVLQPKKEMFLTPSNYSAAGVSRELDSFQNVQDDRNEKDNGLYNFFVDVLENTISVYNVNLEQPTEIKDNSSVKFLEIDENVAEKLKIKDSDTSEEEIRQPIYTEHFDIRDDNIETPIVNRKIKMTKRERTKQRKAIEHGNKKNELLNILREELSQTTEYHEPENIFEALKQIVKNKKKTKKLRFEDKNPQECKLKKRKILDFKEPKFYQDYKIGRERPHQSIARPIKATPKYSDESLKVYDFDYVTLPKETPKQNPVVLLTYHSSNELKENFNPEVILQYSESEASADLKP